MKPKRTFLDELDTTSKSYRVKVRVIEKSRPKTSPTKGTVYQSVVIQDDKGNRMRGALFGDQVDGYQDAFVYNGNYEIANAPIKRCDPQWKRNLDDLDFQMTFGNDTVIQPLDVGSSSAPPNYTLISNIPRAASGDEKYDALGIIVYVEEKARTITTSKDRETFVREILVVDACTEHPVTISAWNDLATGDADSLLPFTAAPIVVAFTALRVSAYKGFSLATTMSTAFIRAPKGPAAVTLHEWAIKNRSLLNKTQAKIQNIKRPNHGSPIGTIAALLAKKMSSTLQEERYWLEVQILAPELNQILAYIGCSSCGKRTEWPLGEHHTCSSCSKNNSVACERITFTSEVSDTTGKLKITAFNAHAEQLLRLKAPQIFHLKETGSDDTFKALTEDVRNNKYRIQVGPKATLSRNNVLQWVLKQVADEPAPNKQTHQLQTLAAATTSGNKSPTTGSLAASDDDTDFEKVATSPSNNATTAMKDEEQTAPATIGTIEST